MQSVIPQAAKSTSRVVSFQVKETRSRARSLAAAGPKLNAKPRDAFADDEQAMATNPPVLSARMMQALRDDSDPVESLADIRGLLVGPATRVHEARIEELLSIMEEADRGYQHMFRELHSRGDALVETTDVIKLDAAKTNEAIVNASTQQDLNLLQASREMGQALKEIAQKFENNFQKLFSDLSHRIEHLATKTADDHQALLNNITKRMHDHESATFANDEHILAKLENQLAAAEANMNAQRSNDLNSLADGLANLSDIVTKLRMG